ncbi:MAG: extracellular solute-binding protein [Sphaerochaetaceae bacterium]|nr:extracellular solute-binding protein [Sphaerochaetaceae bacterium]
MKKTISVLLVMFAALMFVFANGGAESQEKMNLIIYSAGTEEEAQTVADAFCEKNPNIEVTIIQASSGDIVTRAKTEWPQPEGDVVFLMGSENLDQIEEQLAGYKTKNDKKIKDEYKDTKHDTPKYYATSMPLQAIMYNTELLKGDMIPKAWKDLADPKYRGMIELANPATSGSAYAQLYQMKCLYGMEFVKAVAENGTVYVSSSTKGPKDVARGEFAISVTGEANIAQLIADGSPVAYVHPAEGTGLRTEGCAILQNCRNEKAAQLFMDFITSKDGFAVVSSLGRRTVSTEVPSPEHLPALKDMKFYEYNTDEAASLKKSLQKEFSTYIMN